MVPKRKCVAVFCFVLFCFVRESVCVNALQVLALPFVSFRSCRHDLFSGHRSRSLESYHTRVHLQEYPPSNLARKRNVHVRVAPPIPASHEETSVVSPEHHHATALHRPPALRSMAAVHTRVPRLHNPSLLFLPKQTPPQAYLMQAAGSTPPKVGAQKGSWRLENSRIPQCLTVSMCVKTT